MDYSQAQELLKVLKAILEELKKIAEPKAEKTSAKTK